MNGLKQDIDGTRALTWRKQSVSSSLASSSKSINSKKDLCDSIAQSIRQFSFDVYGNENEQKYSRIADLVLLRIKSDLESVNFISADPDNVKTIVENELKSAFTDNEENAKCSDAIKSISAKILELVGNETLASSDGKKDISKKELTISGYSKKQINQSLHLNEIDKIVSRSDDIICSVSSQINQQFESLESLIASHFDSFHASDAEKNAVQTISKLSSLQAKNAQIQFPAHSIRSAEKKTKKEKETILAFDGMRFSSKMVEDLSSDAISTSLHSIHLVKKRNAEVIESFHEIESCVEKNSKHTDKMIKKLSESTFSKIVKWVFRKIIGLSKGELFSHIKSLLLKLILAMLPDKWAKLISKVIIPAWARIRAAIDLAKRHFQLVFNAFKAKLLLIWKGMIKVFKAISGWIKKTFDIAFKIFKSAIEGVINAFKIALKAVFRAVVAVIKGLFKTLVWGIRMAVKGVVWLAKYGWEKLMNSKFGGFLKRCWAAISKPFKLLGEKIGRAFRKIRIAYKRAKRAIVNKVKSLVGKVKTKVAKVLTSVKGFFGKIGGAVKSGFRKLGSFLGKHIVNAFNKIPGSKYIKKLSKKILKMIGKKLFKKKSEDIMKKSLAKKIAQMLAKLAAKLTISGGPINVPKLLISLLSLAWTIWDMSKTYDALKEMLEPMAKEAGYDTSRPAWFEVYMVRDVLPQVVGFVFSGEFYKMLWNAIKDICKNTFYEIQYLSYSLEQRQKVHDENLKNYSKYTKIFNQKYKNFDIDNPKNIDDFIKNQFTAYQLLIKNANIIKTQNEKISYYDDIINNDYEGELEKVREKLVAFEDNFGIVAQWRGKRFAQKELQELRNEEQRLKEKVEKIKNDRADAADHRLRHMLDKLNAITGIVEYAAKSGMDWYTRLRKLVNNTDLENYDSIIFELYNEAYSGIKYLELLKHKKEINERLEEKVREQRIWHAEHDFDIDEFERALKDMVDERNKFEEKAKNINEWLNNCENIKQEPLIRLKQHLRYMFKLEDEDGNIPEYDDGLTKEMFDIVTYGDAMQ